jgi:hypothetical protein
MITVGELINKLSEYASRDANNLSAQVMLAVPGSDVCLEFFKADDLRGFYSEHYLVFIPDESGKQVGVKGIRPA